MADTPTRADRNNNPGNLRPRRIIWNGQTGIDSDGFAIFNSRENGVRAADLNLQTYNNNGYDTVSKIISHWSATDQASYTKSVADGIGTDPNTHLDLNNATVRRSILAQIFNFEGSDTRYSADSGTLGNFVNTISDGTAAVYESVANAFNGTWIAELISKAFHPYILPILLGGGAVLLIIASSWGLVKDSPVGSVVKTGAKLAVTKGL